MPPKKAFSKAPFLPPVQPLQTETVTKTQVESPILIGTIMVCAVAVGLAFATLTMNMVIRIGVTTITDNESINNFNSAKVIGTPVPAGAKYVDVTRGGTVEKKAFTTTLYKDSCDYIASSSVKLLREYFVKSDNTVGLAIYDCSPNVCNFNRCEAPATPPATPICTDSDLSSDQTFPYISGNSDPFIKGATTGLTIHGDGSISIVPETSIDVCYNPNQLTEFYCSNGKVTNTGINCINGCVDGACVRLGAGDLIKSVTYPAVYYYGKDGKKHLISHRGVLTSWGWDFIGVKVLRPAQFDQIQTGENLTVRPVGYIIKFDSSQNYYFVMQNNQIKKFANEAAIIRLFGNNWQNRVIIVPATFEVNYTKLVGEITVNDKYPNGSIITYKNNIGIFYIQDGKSRLFNNSALLPLNNISLGLVASTEATSTMYYPGGLEITGKEYRFYLPY